MPKSPEKESLVIIKGLEKKAKTLEKKEARNILPFQRHLREAFRKKKTPEQEEEEEKEVRVKEGMSRRLKLLAKMIGLVLKEGKPCNLNRLAEKKALSNLEIRELFGMVFTEGERKEINKRVAKELGITRGFSTITTKEELAAKMGVKSEDVSDPGSGMWHTCSNSEKIPGLFCLRRIPAVPGHHTVTYPYDMLPGNEQDKYYYIPPTSKEK